ncbi:MAG TPA: FAD-dependent oxidoreductase [Bradyrhizobium sp.]|nr:FAD-dependent oxidoreductase [Bradyrhizobium sp.]
MSTRISRLSARKKKQRLDGILRGTSTVQALPPLPQIPGLLLLSPGDRQYDKLLPVYNLRTAVRPALRALCQTPASVAGVPGWVKQYALPFAIRSGGHSFEGYSNSSSVVIDLRGLKYITFDAMAQTISVGAGVPLGDIYKKLSNQNAAFAAGSCPYVGVVGHTLGGGYGLLARAHGLCCDNLQSIVVVDAEQNFVTASGVARRHRGIRRQQADGGFRTRICVGDAGRFGAEIVNAGTFLPCNAASDREQHTALQQVCKTAPAKGAMAFRPASLYWCG